MGAMSVTDSVPQPPAAAPAAEQGPVRPSSAWYWIGAAIMVLGIVGGTAFGVIRFTDTVDKIDDFPRLAVPSDREVSLDEGGYTLFHEYPGAASDYGFRFAPEVEITAPDGSSVPISPYGNEETYSFGDHEGRAISTFRADADGVYRVQVLGEPNSFESIAIGDSYIGGMLLAIFGGMALAGLGVVIGGIVMIVTGVRRGRAQRARRPAPAFAGGPAPYGGPGGYSAPTWGAPPPPGAWPAPSGAPTSWGAPPPPGGYGAPAQAWAPPPPASPAPPPPSSAVPTGWPSPSGSSFAPAPPSPAPSPAPAPGLGALAGAGDPRTPGPDVRGATVAPSGPTDDPDQAGWASPAPDVDASPPGPPPRPDAGL